MARQLRSDPTPAEQRLWDALRDRRLAGLKFRFQHPVGRFILDFYCPSEQLVIEVDGASHDGRAAHDQARTQVLSTFGYRVLRVRNEEVLSDLPAVLSRIIAATRLTPPESPPNPDDPVPTPALGEGQAPGG
jgi:very-short-patch-repair endonuclease